MTTSDNQRSTIDIINLQDPDTGFLRILMKFHGLKFVLGKLIVKST